MLALLIIASPMALAQSGCTGDPCLFDTPTTTPTVTPWPTVGTGTPTPVGMPSSVPFPYPNYNAPTSIPQMAFPPVPSPLAVTLPAPTPITNLTPMPFPLPNPLTGTLLVTAPAPITLSVINISTGATPITLSTIDTSVSIGYSELLTLGASGGFTGGISGDLSFVTGLDADGRAVISDVVSYTNYLSGEVASIAYTETLAIDHAPSWYAPKLPRDMADIGWTFEQFSSPTGEAKRYSLNTWSFLFGTMISMPVRLVRGVWDLLYWMGPFGLFLGWLIVIMLPAVLGFRILQFIKATFIRVFNFILAVLEWLLKLWQAVPWYLGGPG